MPGIRERLKGILRPGGYDPGDKVRAQVKDIDGVTRGVEFEIERYCGGGFAGQVYRARLISSQDNWLNPGDSVALKFFCTRSGFRRFFRNLLYFISFQSPFPHQFNEPAVKTGLLLTRLLRIVSRVEFGSVGPINDCYGMFWDSHVGSYAEVNEWVEGRVTDPDVDREILNRLSHNRRVKRARRTGGASAGEYVRSETEIARKKRFMGQIVSLCSDLGIDDLARQVYWWTGMSQPNVLTRNSGTDQAEFVWVDRRPGLPGLLLSLGDFVLLTKAVFRGSIPPFDRIDFPKLRAWSKAPDRESWESLVDQLWAVDAEYRSAQVDLFGHHIKLLTSRKLRLSIVRSIVDYWHKTGVIDEGAGRKFQHGVLRVAPHILLSCIPFLGLWLRKMMANADYRRHLRAMVLDGSYRRQYFDNSRNVTVAMWLREERVTEARAEKCLGSFWAYFGDKVCVSWLPAPWQRFLTDWRRAAMQTGQAFLNAFRYIFDLDHRSRVNHDWVVERTEEDIRHGYLSRDEAEVFVSSAGAGAMQQYITGIMVTIALLPASEITFVLLALVGWSQLGDWESFKSALASLGFWKYPLGFVLVTMSPGGLMRLSYCLVQWIRHPGVPYGAAAVLAPFRAIGYLSFPVQIARAYRQFSGYLLTWSVCYLVNIVPVFGERGGLLNIWAVAVLLSWPASLREWRHQRSPINLP